MKNIFNLILLLLPLYSSAQEIPVNKYGLHVVTSVEMYKLQAASDPNMELVRVTDIPVDVKYATADNFTKQALYPFAAVWLRRPVYEALLDVQKVLEPLGLSLKIYDGYRPYRVTEKMWELVKDDRYAANPKNGSGHNRGAAVDLTIIYTKSGKEMEMPTGYDDFTEKAHHGYTKLSAEALENRELLKTFMEVHGFKALNSEWWHYAPHDAAIYPLMDIGFEDLK